MKLAIYLLLILALVSSALSIEDFTITGSSYTVTRTIQENDEVHAFIAQPGAYEHVSVQIVASTDYVVRLVVTDENKNVLKEMEVSPGTEDAFTVTSGKADTYRFVVETFKSIGQQFTLSYHTQTQNDANTGTDASANFREGIIIQPGVYVGFVGDGDLYDYYRMDLKAQETISMTLTPAEKDSPRLTLIDGRLDTKINTRAQVEGEEIAAEYTSLRDQTVYIGVEGKEPYTLSVISSEDVDEVPEDVVAPPSNTDMPPPPPDFPGPVYDGDAQPVAVEPPDPIGMPPSMPPPETQQNTSLAWIWLAVIVLFLILVVLYLLKPKKVGDTEKDSSEAKKKK